MNQAIAKSTNVHTSARKLRLIAGLVRNLSAQQAVDILSRLNHRAAKPLLLTVKQGIANATKNFQLDKNKLMVSEIQINEGPIMKRSQAVSRGVSHRINKRTAHIIVGLREKENNGTKS